MSRMFVLLIFLAGSVEAKEVFRCIDPDTGSVTFTDRGCKTGDDGTVHTFSGNVVHSLDKQPAKQSSTSGRQEVEAQRPQAFLIEDPATRALENSREVSRDMEKLCRQAARPHSGAQNGQLTASQREVLAMCAGLPTAPRGQTGSYSVPAPTRAPAPIASCDPGGCWDTQGGRYTQGAGATYFNPNGVACQLIAGQMHCP